MKSSIYWMLIAFDLLFLGAKEHFNGEQYSPEQTWYAILVLLFFRIIVLWVVLIATMNYQITVKKWERAFFIFYAVCLLIHTVWGCVYTSRALFG